MKCVHDNRTPLRKFAAVQLPALTKGAKNINLYIQSLICFVVGLYFSKTPTQKVLVLLLCVFPVTIEFINTSVELTNDRFGCGYNANTKDAKDVMAAASMLSKLPVFTYLAFLILPLGASNRRHTKYPLRG